MKPVEFLRKFQPDGFWVLTAIEVDRKGIETATFTPDEADAALAWIDERNGKANLYFSVNQPARRLTRKASREDIVAAGWLHVDVDARAGEPVEEELERIRLLLTAKLPPGIPRPTVLIASGGGFQAFWRLAQPIDVRDATAKDTLTRYNQQLEIVLEGDHCHNIDRIMRLPGTWNIPNAKKLGLGRKKARAEVHDFAEDLSYDLSIFTPVRGEAGARPLAVQQIDDINTLDKWDVPDRVKVIIVQGHHPDEVKNGDGSRSGWLFDAVCNMVRCGVPDGVIYGLITDPDRGISASVLDKGKDAKSYAERQIIQAHGEVGNDPIAWVNARYFAATEGGKAAFFREEGDGCVTALDKTTFEFELATKRTNDEKRTPYSKLWIPDPRRRYYPKGFVLTPEASPEGYYNLWRGFSVEPERGSWDRMREHIHEVLAAGNDQYADYIINWTAWSVQHPHVPPRVALVFRSDEEGVGKGAFCNQLVRLFGPHGLRIQHIAHLTGKFNAHLRHCCLLFADEAIATDEDGVLKGMITDPTMPIERKGYDVVPAQNHLHIVMSSNSRWVIPAGADARRFAVFEVSAKYKRNRKYFEALFGEAGLAAMLFDLRDLDLGNWHPEAFRPDTAALSTQKIQSLPPVEAVWFEALYSAEMPCGEAYGDSWKVFTNLFCEYVCDRFRKPVTYNTAADLFKRLGYQYDEKRRPRGWVVPPPAQARATWDEVFFRVEWPDDNGRWYERNVVDANSRPSTPITDRPDDQPTRFEVSP